MEIERIPSTRWREFLRSFSRAHQGWLVTVNTRGSAGVPMRHLKDVPLVGVFDESNRWIIAAGRGRERVDCVVNRPAVLRRRYTADGADIGLDIETSAGEEFRLRFRSAVPTELVDGV